MSPRLAALARGHIRATTSISMLVLVTAAMSQTVPTTPPALLKWSMGKYNALPTFQAECSVKITTAGATAGATTRTIQFSKPNQFKVVSKSAASTQTSVSDGKTLVEYMIGGPFPAQSSSAPASIADTKSVFLNNPMLAGSLLYKFFGGPDHYASLVNDAKMAPMFGPDSTVSGVRCKIVKFWAQGFYGSTEAAIGEKDGLVHGMVYHYEPLIEQTTKMMKSPEFLAQMKKVNPNVDAKTLAKQMPASMLGNEAYTSIKCGEAIQPAVFAAKAPEGQEVQEQGGEPKPPVTLGTPAPEITVKNVDGTSKKLAALRGHVVLIDFWATWCPPCRKGLPETQALYNTYGQKGLAVLTISDEPKSTVTPYLKSNKLTFPAYLDQAGATNKAYHIEAIPTVAVIDKSGNLSAFFVGLQDKAVILAALKKAGL